MQSDPFTSIQQATDLSGSCYAQAVKATVYTEKGNMSLGKAIKASGSASNLLIWFIIFFAAALLFFDWFHS